MKKNQKILKIEDLNVEFPLFGGILQREVSAVHAVKNVNLEIPRGKTIGIVGESGSGKSTLGKAILNVLKLTAPDVRMSGSVFLHNENSSDEGIDILSLNKFDFGKKLRDLEAEVGPIKYISLLVKDFSGVDFALDKAVRIVILILIFVFDPLAILLVISSSISFSKVFKKKLPPDVRKIRNALLDDLEGYLGDGGTAEQFLDRVRN